MRERCQLNYEYLQYDQKYINDSTFLHFLGKIVVVFIKEFPYNLAMTTLTTEVENDTIKEEADVKRNDKTREEHGSHC